MRFSIEETTGPKRRGNVVSSREFRERILKISQREWTRTEAEEWAEKLTPILRSRRGTWNLNYFQGIALKEAYENEGLACRAPVGKGKGLFSLLLPGWLEIDSFGIMLPPSLRDRTLKTTLPLTREHWRLHRDLVYRPEQVIHSSASFQTPKGRKLFQELNLRHFIIDESHQWKDWETTRGSRFIQYLLDREKAGDPARIYFMTGTFFPNSVMDIWFLLRFALPDTGLLPHDVREAKMWANSMDVEVTTRATPGVLKVFMTREEREEVGSGELSEAQVAHITRRAFNRELAKCPGVVIIREPSASTSLSIQLITPYTPELYPTPSQNTLDAFYKLRVDSALPGDEWVSDGNSLWRSSRELACGFYNVWNWRKSIGLEIRKIWLQRRKLWKKCVRQCIKKWAHKGLDSEALVTQAVARGEISSDVVHNEVLYKDTYGMWMNKDGEMPKPGPDFAPPTRVVWHDDYLVDWIAEKTKKTPAIIWTEFPAVGHQLQAKHGIRYYGSRAKNIEHATGEETICASIAAQGTGNNMQMFNHAWILSAIKSASMLEQLIGREHREGQRKDCTVFMLLNLIEGWQGYRKSLELAKMQEDLEGPQKLLYGDTLSMPTDTEIEQLRVMTSPDTMWAEPSRSLGAELDGIHADIEDEETL